MTVSAHTYYHSWRKHNTEDYVKTKEQLTELVLAEVERVIPVKDTILYTATGTPETYNRYVGKAEVGGFPLTVKNAIQKPKGTRSQLPQFYIAGEQVFPGPGTLSSALSGYYAARAIQREM